jgi:hypothetical protein
MTDLEELKEDRQILAGVKVSVEIQAAISKVTKHCPKLFMLLVGGYQGSNWDQMLYEPITTIICRDMVMRFWRYDDFALDFMLA